MNKTIRSLGMAIITAVMAAALVLLATHSARADGPVNSPCNESDFDSALSGGGSITFNCGGPKTITFSYTKAIGNDTTIDGGGVITLSGNNITALFQVYFGKTLTLTNITLANGYAGPISGVTSGGIENIGTLVIINGRLVNHRGQQGGALHNYGEAKLTNTTFTSNSAATEGGAIYNDDGGVITLTNVTISNNFVTTTTISAYGGGVYNAGRFNMNGGSLSNNYGISPTNLMGGGGMYNNGNISTIGVANLTNVTVQGNRSGFAGGLYNYNGTVTLRNTIVNSNTGTGTSGGLYNAGSAAVLKIYNSQITRNSSALGGGLYLANGNITISQTQISRNTATGNGGGIRNYSNASLSIYQSTIDHNQALNGGGIANRIANLYIENSTLHANQAGETAILDSTLSVGGAILSELNGSTVSLLNVTIDQNTANVGAGLQITDVAVLTMRNTAISDTCNVGSVLDNGGNRAVDSNCLGATHHADLKLGPLTNNGGSTPTQLPKPGSPLIDGGFATGCPAQDQRGKTRPYNSTCDSGAVEFSAGDPTRWVYLPLVLKNK